MLLNHACALLAARAVVFRESPVFSLQADVLMLDACHMISHGVHVTLELVFNLSGQVGAVGADLFQVFPLFRTGDLEGNVCREERIDLVQKSPGNIVDRTQGLGKLSFGCFLVDLQLLFFCGDIPPQLDGLQVEVVPFFGNLLHFHLHGLH